MVEWVVGADRLCGIAAGERVTVELDSWRIGGRPPPLDAGSGAVCAVTTDGVGLPSDPSRVVTDGGRLSPAAGRLRDDVHRVAVDGPLDTVVAFEGPATVDGDWIGFPEPTPVAVGVCDPSTSRAAVRVPATPSGLATAVTAAGRTHLRADAGRSHPGYRPGTPAVRFGERSVPDRLEARGDGPTLTVPDTVQDVLVAAPLAYYLGATLRVGSGPPFLRGGATDVTFDPLPAFADQVAAALRRLYHLDCSLRPHVDDVHRTTDPAVLEQVDDPSTLAEAAPVERLTVALDLAVDLPEWPLATYVDEDVRNGRFLPSLLDRSSLVYPASASSLDPGALLERSLDEFFRGDAPNVDAVDPTLADSRHHAWRADGTPVDAYTLLGSGAPAEAADGPLRVDVVCNEPEMWSEREVVDVYRSRLDDQDVHVHDRLTRAELASVLERETDLVHFVGHCEVDGLVCPDGTLSADDLSRCGARTFFLNACGSYYEGHGLVGRGATAGAVTLTPVLDAQAVRLGTAFARLLVEGFAFDRALSLARGEIIVGRDYAVVGDGCYRLRPSRTPTGVLHLDRHGDSFRARYDALAPDGAGREYVDPFHDEVRPIGEPATATLDPQEAVELLDRLRVPVRYDGHLGWAADVARELESAGQ